MKNTTKNLLNNYADATGDNKKGGSDTMSSTDNVNNCTKDSERSDSILSPNEISALNTDAHDTDVSGGLQSVVTPELAFDRSACIKRATEDYIASLTKPISLTDEELRDGCMIFIENAIAERNVIKGGGKVATPSQLPNPCIAMLIMTKYHVRSVSWTGNRSEGAVVSVYQESGPDAGIYKGSPDLFNSLIRRFEFNANSRDIADIIKILEADAPLITPSTDQDLIAFNNGIFNYKTKQLLPFTPELCFVTKCKVNYPQAPVSNPHITMPDGVVWDFESWLESISDNPEIFDLILKMIGAVLRPYVRWDRIVTLCGPAGMNGKGTLCELMRQLCGENYYASLRFIDFAKDSLVAQLLHSNAIITDENDVKDYAKNISNLKAAATGDVISIDRKYLSSIKFRFNGLIVQCINGFPRTDDQTDSFYRRLLLIPFNKTFKGVERKYIKSDYLHRSDVLEYVAWRVMTLPDYYDLPEPVVCKSLLNDYRSYNDPVLEFMDEIFPQLAWNKVPLAFIYDLYLNWSRKNNPSGRFVGKSAMISRILSNLDSHFKGVWSFQKQETRINKDDNLAPELLIYEYGLENWRSSTYKGTDPAKISMPTFRRGYRNTLIRN